METKEELILNGNINKAIINLSIPLMINSFIQTLYSLVDGLYLSRLGTVEFAATSLVFPVIWLFLTFAQGVSSASTSIMSQLLGMKKEKRMQRISFSGNLFWNIY